MIENIPLEKLDEHPIQVTVPTAELTVLDSIARKMGAILEVVGFEDDHAVVRLSLPDHHLNLHPETEERSLVLADPAMLEHLLKTATPVDVVEAPRPHDTVNIVKTHCQHGARLLVVDTPAGRTYILCVSSTIVAAVLDIGYTLYGRLAVRVGLGFSPAYVRVYRVSLSH